MTAQFFDHERLDVYRLSIDYILEKWLCTVIQDVPVTTKGNSNQDESAMKVMQYRSVTLLTLMAAMKFDGVGESSVGHSA